MWAVLAEVSPRTMGPHHARGSEEETFGLNLEEWIGIAQAGKSRGNSMQRWGSVACSRGSKSLGWQEHAGH